MSTLEIHTTIKEKLDLYVATRRIPHLIFYGPAGGGKRHILNHLVQRIYPTEEEKKKFDRNRVIYGIISAGLLGYSGYQAFFTNQNHTSSQFYWDNQPNRFFLYPYWTPPRSGLQIKKPF